MRISFTVVGDPVPKARPRTVRKGGRTWSYTPKKVTKWEDVVRAEALKFFDEPFNGPVALSLVFFLKRPKTRRKENFVVTTPDLDNLEKAFLDGLNEVAYLDDKQVVVKNAVKRYIVGGEPRVEVTVVPLRNQLSLDSF
ncbi:MAG: RusA family crossover junction endodeoxyribonuclease [Candidatus Bathyarchaeota archaeon]|nr:RusA family crossover junction endodeoxyribonuclease [Candidatus Bathyarchaeota archaeon]